MGRTQYAYIGPYVQCQTTKTPRPQTVRACPRQACVQYQHSTIGSFCATCGTQITNFTINIEEEQDIGDIIDDLHDELVYVTDNPIPEGIHVWILNVNRDPPRKYYFNSNDGQFVSLLQDLTQVDIQAETHDLEVKFTDEIEILKRHYGDANVTIHWGSILHAE